MARNHILQIGTASPSPSPSSATRLIYDDFSQGDFTGDMNQDGSEVQSSVVGPSTMIPVANEYCVEIDYSGGNNLNGLVCSWSSSSYDRTLYTSFWFRYADGFEWDNGQGTQNNHKVCRFTGIDGGGGGTVNFERQSKDFVVNQNDYLFINYDFISSINDCNAESPGDVVINSYKDGWYEWMLYEEYTVVNTYGNEDGEYAHYINGEEIASFSGALYCSTHDPENSDYRLTKLYAPHNMADAAFTNPKVYYDEHEVWAGDPRSCNTFMDRFETGNKNKWNNPTEYSQFTIDSSSLMIGTYCLKEAHTSGSSNSGSMDLVFGDASSDYYTNNYPGDRCERVVVYGLFRFDNISNFPSDGSAKLLIIESWPSGGYPSTQNMEFQAILEIAQGGELVITPLVDTGWDYGSTYQSGLSPAANTDYRFRMEIGINDYGSSNGIVKLDVNGSSLINVTNANFNSNHGSAYTKGLNSFKLTGYDGGSGATGTYNTFWDNICLRAYKQLGT